MGKGAVRVSLPLLGEDGSLEKWSPRLIIGHRPRAHEWNGRNVSTYTAFRKLFVIKLVVYHVVAVETNLLKHLLLYCTLVWKSKASTVRKKGVHELNYQLSYPAGARGCRAAPLSLPLSRIYTFSTAVGKKVLQEEKEHSLSSSLDYYWRKPSEGHLGTFVQIC